MQNEIIFTLTRHVLRIQHKTETDCLACFFSYDNSKSVIFSILSEFTNLCNQANSGRILIRSFPELAIESNKFDARLSLMIGSGLFFSLTITVNRLSFLPICLIKQIFKILISIKRAKAASTYGNQIFV